MLSDKTVNKDELKMLRKVVEKLQEKVERQVRSVKESLSEYTERQTVDKTVFDQEQESVQGKLRDLDMSVLKMLKIIQYLKSAPWTKTIKAVKQDVDKQGLLLSEQMAQQEKHAKELRTCIDHDLPTWFKNVQGELHVLADKQNNASIAHERALNEWQDNYERKFVSLGSDMTDHNQHNPKEHDPLSRKSKSGTVNHTSPESVWRKGRGH